MELTNSNYKNAKSIIKKSKNRFLNNALLYARLASNAIHKRYKSS